MMMMMIMINETKEERLGKSSSSSATGRISTTTRPMMQKISIAIIHAKPIRIRLTVGFMECFPTKNESVQRDQPSSSSYDSNFREDPSL